MFSFQRFFRLFPYRSQDDGKAASDLERLVLDVTLKSPDEGARQV
jgi:hypothetical protein